MAQTKLSERRVHTLKEAGMTKGRENWMQPARAVEGPQGNVCVNPFARLAGAPESFVTLLYLEEGDFTSDGSVDWAYRFLGLGDS